MKRGLVFVIVLAAFVLLAFWFFQRRARTSEAFSATLSDQATSSSAQKKFQAKNPVVAVKNTPRISLPTPKIPRLNLDLVPMHFRPLFSGENLGGYVPRRHFVGSLGQELSGNEIRALLMFVHATPQDVGLSESSYNAVGDEVLLKLEDQKKLPVDYSDHLVVMHYDQTRNRIWRDYCIQHLGTVYSRIPEQKRPVVRQLYMDALKPKSDFAGTALLSMRRSIAAPDMDKALVAEEAMKVASSDAYTDAERRSALLVAAEFNHSDALRLARKIVGSDHTAPFRASAMATLGMVGDDSDIPRLKKYTQSSDFRFRSASAAALKKLTRRNAEELAAADQ